jgi:hypothetical protein
MASKLDKLPQGQANETYLYIITASLSATTSSHTNDIDQVPQDTWIRVDEISSLETMKFDAGTRLFSCSPTLGKFFGCFLPWYSSEKVDEWWDVSQTCAEDTCLQCWSKQCRIDFWYISVWHQHWKGVTSGIRWLFRNDITSGIRLLFRNDITSGISLLFRNDITSSISLLFRNDISARMKVTFCQSDFVGSVKSRLSLQCFWGTLLDVTIHPIHCYRCKTAFMVPVSLSTMALYSL